MTDAEKHIEKLETEAIEVRLLAQLACEPAKRSFNAKLAGDLLELAKLLRTDNNLPLHRA